MNNDPNSVYAPRHHLGSNDHYVSYNTVDPYDSDLNQQEHHYNPLTQLVDAPMPSNHHHNQRNTYPIDNCNV